MYKAEIKNNRKSYLFHFQGSIFYSVFLMQLSKCIHHVRCILADINQNISITKLHFICETSIKTNITEDELQK